MDAKQEEMRGEEARRILDAPIYQEAWAQLRENIVRRLEQPEVPAAERELMNNLLIAHRKAKQYMEQVLVTGTMAAMEQERKRTLAERVFRRA